MRSRKELREVRSTRVAAHPANQRGEELTLGMRAFVGWEGERERDLDRERLFECCSIYSWLRLLVSRRFFYRGESRFSYLSWLWRCRCIWPSASGFRAWWAWSCCCLSSRPRGALQESIFFERLIFDRAGWLRPLPSPFADFFRCWKDLLRC